MDQRDDVNLDGYASWMASERARVVWEMGTGPGMTLGFLVGGLMLTRLAEARALPTSRGLAVLCLCVVGGAGVGYLAGRFVWAWRMRRRGLP